jgi:serine/threonine-protein kinase RsbW
VSAIGTPTNHESRLVCDESAPAQARAAIRSLNPRAPLIGDAMLVVSELVTNAVRHSGCDATDHIELRAALLGSAVRIEVRDPGRTRSIPCVAIEGDHFGGMGLRLVEALSDSWGAERGGEQVVWAEISL